MKIKVRKEWLLAALLLLTALPWNSMIDPDSQIGGLTPDSDQYIQFAARLASYEIPLTDKARYLVRGEEIRTPAYPIILLPALYINQQRIPLGQAIYIVHLMMALILLCFFIVTLYNQLPLSNIIIAFATGNLVIRHFSGVVMTEWSVYLFLCFFAVSVYNIFVSASIFKYCALGFISSVLTLLRPDYIILFPICLIFIFLNRFQIKKSYLCYIIGFAPVFFWIFFQWSRFGKLTIAPVEGHAFSLMSTLGEIEIIGADKELTDFAVNVNDDLEFADYNDLITVPFFFTDNFVDKATHNLDLAHQYMKKKEISWQNMNLLLLKYVKIALVQKFFNYLIVITIGMLTLIWALPVIFILRKLFRQSGKTYRELTPLIKTSFICLFIHIFHVCFVACINVMYLRYYIPTFATVVTFTILAYFQANNGKFKQGN